MYTAMTHCTACNNTSKSESWQQPLSPGSDETTADVRCPHCGKGPTFARALKGGEIPGGPLVPGEF